MVGMRYGMITEGEYKGRLCYFKNTTTKTNYICRPVDRNPYQIVMKKTAVKELTKSQFNLVRMVDEW